MEGGKPDQSVFVTRTNEVLSLDSESIFKPFIENNSL